MGESCLKPFQFFHSLQKESLALIWWAAKIETLRLLFENSNGIFRRANDGSNFGQNSSMWLSPRRSSLFRTRDAELSEDPELPSSQEPPLNGVRSDLELLRKENSRKDPLTKRGLTVRLSVLTRWPRESMTRAPRGLLNLRILTSKFWTSPKFFHILSVPSLPNEWKVLKRRPRSRRRD